jgi:hypothetical protein
MRMSCMSQITCEDGSTADVKIELQYLEHSSEPPKAQGPSNAAKKGARGFIQILLESLKPQPLKKSREKEAYDKYEVTLRSES